MAQPEAAIIGAGPIGIELAAALRRKKIPYVHFDAGQIGSTMLWWPPQTRWFSSNDRIAIAGVPLQTADQLKCTREDYLRYLRTIVQQFDLHIHTYEPVTRIEKKQGGFIIHTNPLPGPRSYESRRVILATGGTSHPRKLDVPGEDLPHVSHYMQDPHIYFRRRVLVVGGRNSAVEAALRLQNVGADVTLSYRRESFDRESIKYWLYPEISGHIKSGAIRAFFNTTVHHITPEQVILADCRNGRQQTVRADFVLLLVGYVADMTLAQTAGVELRGENQIPVFDEGTMETNVPGLFIAGTATGGTQTKFRIFLENCHIHVDRIVAAIEGAPPPPPPILPSQAET